MPQSRIADAQIEVGGIRRPRSIAVLVPCYNEAATIGTVVEGFRAVLPEARIYVYDNNSTDGTRGVAERAGAIVCRETKQGKGSVVRRMFRDIDADIYLMVDGDATYDPATAPDMISLLEGETYAMVVARRVHESSDAYRPGHVLGNALFTRTVAWLFGKAFTDILSGYRAFNRAFVKSFPTSASGFDIEAELTIHALSLSLPVGEVDSPYRERPAGSASKLRTYQDGIRILRRIVNLTRTERPLLFYTVVGAVFALAALVLAYPIVVTFLRTGLVPRFPTAMISMGLMIIAFVSMVSGLLLDAMTKVSREMKLLAYLNIGAQRPLV